MKSILTLLILTTYFYSSAQMQDFEKVDAQGIDIKFEIADTKGKNKEAAPKEVCLILTNTNKEVAKVSFTLVFMVNNELDLESDGMSFEIKAGKTIKGKAKGLCWEFTDEQMKQYESGELVLDLNDYEVKL